MRENKTTKKLLKHNKPRINFIYIFQENMDVRQREDEKQKISLSIYFLFYFEVCYHNEEE